MRPELNQLFLFCIFVSLLPYPRTLLYRDGFVKFLETTIGFVIFIGEFLRPVASLLKVDMQSKLVSGAIVLSTAAPRIGRTILSTDIDTSELKTELSRDVKKNMLDFRFFVLQQFSVNYELTDAVEKEDLVVEINRTHSQIRRRHAIGELIVAIIIGGLSILVTMISILHAFAFLLAVFGIIFPLSMRLRTLVVDTLAFSAKMIDENENLYDRPPRVARLRFMKRWNEMLIGNEEIIHKLIFVSFAKGEFPIGYERGADVMEEVLGEGKDLDKALDEMVNEEFGEDTVESRWFRRLIKRFLGV